MVNISRYRHGTQSLEMRNIRVRTIALHRLPDRLRNLTQTCIAVSGGWNDGCAISDQRSRQSRCSDSAEEVDKHQSKNCRPRGRVADSCDLERYKPATVRSSLKEPSKISRGITLSSSHGH